MRLPVALLLLLGLPATPAMADGFNVTGPDIHNGATIPMVHVFGRCGGGNQSPALSWSGAPRGTASYAVTMFDPDAPSGHGWWHWILVNIPTSVTSLPENAGAAGSRALPAGALQGRNDFGFSNYDGPCPPTGAAPHRYVITVYAVNVSRLDIGPQASGATVEAALHRTTLATAALVGRWGRANQ
ncbi:MAG TPA: YbhB/YbcL family Raf kinase inhibitor-like protein [Acetobacteraceae bacterium]|nr:YbhB/YbcL family Raf kinase inhibitor-like protein [Acetobacteraceae bacterium]